MGAHRACGGAGRNYGAGDGTGEADGAFWRMRGNGGLGAGYGESFRTGHSGVWAHGLFTPCYGGTSSSSRVGLHQSAGFSATLLLRGMV